MPGANKTNKKLKNTTGATVGYEAELWRMADALRGSMDAAEYKHVVLGLIFLKYIRQCWWNGSRPCVSHWMTRSKETSANPAPSPPCAMRCYPSSSPASYG